MAGPILILATNQQEKKNRHFLKTSTESSVFSFQTTTKSTFGTYN